MAGIVAPLVSKALVPTSTKAVVAVPSTTSVSSSSAVSSSKASSSTTTSIVSSTTSSSIASSTTSSIASTPSSSRASSSSSSSRFSTSSLRPSSTVASSSSAPSASSSAAPADTGISSLAKSLIIAGIVVASAIALIVAVGFLLRRRRDGRRDRRDRTHELDGYGKDGAGGDVSSPHIEKDQPGVGDERFVQALGRGERPSGRAGSGMGGIYGASSGAGAMYAGSEASLQQPPMAVNDGGWGSAGGYDTSGYPPQQPYSPGGFAPPGSASQQYLVPRGASPAFSHNNQQQQQPYSPSYSTPQDEYFRSPSPYGQPPPPQQQSYYNSNQSYDAQPQQHDPYQDPSPLEAQAMAGVGGDPALGGALVPGGALDEEGVEMRVVRGFKATLEDELAIVPFILLRVHQSYEDGWSLCSNPGTKERGVVPRDCLALPSSIPSNALPPPPSPPSSQPRILPQIPSQSFSSNLYDPSSTDRSSQYLNNSKHQEAEALDENNHPLAPPPTFGFAVGYEDIKGRPLSVVVRDEDGTEREVMRSELGPSGVAGGSSSTSGEFGGLNVAGIPRSHTASSLTPSERNERRSSLMDSVRAAGAYLDQGGVSGTHL